MCASASFIISIAMSCVELPLALYMIALLQAPSAEPLPAGACGRLGKSDSRKHEHDVSLKFIDRRDMPVTYPLPYCFQVHRPLDDFMIFWQILLPIGISPNICRQKGSQGVRLDSPPGWVGRRHCHSCVRKSAPTGFGACVSRLSIREDSRVSVVWAVSCPFLHRPPAASRLQCRAASRLQFVSLKSHAEEARRHSATYPLWWMSVLCLCADQAMAPKCRVAVSNCPWPVETIV